MEIDYPVSEAVSFRHDMKSNQGMFLVELTTRQGRISERYETYEEARRRVEQFPADSIVGLAFIFQELPDGSERLVREDGKPLQFHRRLVEETNDCSDEPISLVEEPSEFLGPERTLRFVDLKPPEDRGEDRPPEVRSKRTAPG